jgi:1,4-alpha-glucan branching enzyme
LGLHRIKDGFVVRVFRPDAESIKLAMDAEELLPMVRGPSGLFEVRVPKEAPYRLQIRTAGGREIRLDDAYRYPPSLGELDVHLAREGRHELLYQKLGAHVRELAGANGVAFAVWAPGARGVSVVGNFNAWDGRLHAMRNLGGSGIWELFVPGLESGAVYKFEIRTAGGGFHLKADPLAFRTELPPKTASIVDASNHRFEDAEWIGRRGSANPLRQPQSIYEVHLGSWRRIPEEGNRALTYRELAPLLADYLTDLGFTHAEFLPVMEHPFGGSWGYQVTSYFAPTARHGAPDDLRHLIDHLHRRGIGVILDWVPAHFPKDEFALGRFDGTALYEHLDPRQGEHPDWGTFVFNYGRREVRNFLLASALYWLSEFHVDGLRLDAVASMLYLDYSRRPGEWIPNRFGGNENLEAIEFLKELNAVAYGRHPGIAMIAEESTAWPGVSRPIYAGGLGFGFKWDMGWMHDTLRYFSKEPLYRQYHHHDLTFGLLYAWSENFILPLSHDEVVHGKRSLLDKMPGTRRERFANLRALYGYMWARPGKKLLFMGGEIGQWSEWSHDQSLDWHLLAEAEHRGVQDLIRDLNRIYRNEPALWEGDVEPAGFRWIDANDAAANVISFLRRAPSSGRELLCLCNFSGKTLFRYRIGLPRHGHYREIVNTDAGTYGGSNAGNLGGVNAAASPSHGFPFSGEFTLPALSTMWFEVPRD